MKIVCSSDWHGDAVTDGLRRADDVEAAVRASVDEAIRIEADAYLFLGDLCDPTSVRAFRAVAFACEVARRLASAGIASVFLTGNHDVVEDGSGDHTLLPIAAALVGLVIDRPGHYALNDKAGDPCGTLVALPYTPASHSYDPAAEVERMAGLGAKGLPTVVVGHLNLAGITPGSESTHYARGRDVFWPVDALRQHLPGALLLGGHYHSRQVHDGVQIVGSMCRLTHGEEANRPGYLVVEV